MTFLKGNKINLGRKFSKERRKEMSESRKLYFSNPENREKQGFLTVVVYQEQHSGHPQDRQHLAPKHPCIYDRDGNHWVLVL